MEKNFEKIIKEGISIDDTLKTELGKKLPNIEEFIENGKIRFWRFVKGKKDWVFPKMGDYVLFEIEKERTIYITLSSDTIEDSYDKTVKNYRLLKSPNPTIYNPRYKNYIKFPKAFLVKLLGDTKNTELLEMLKELCTCEEFSHALVYCGKCPEETFNRLLSSRRDEKIEGISIGHGNSTTLGLTIYFQAKGYYFPVYLTTQFYTALKTKGFVILSGLTGTGKTKIAQELAELLNHNPSGENPGSLLFLPVRPDWRDSKALLGYYNPLTGEYQRTQLLDFILKAIADYDKNRGNAMPYFVILDEMNLAHVEYYFADFLSVLESGRDENGFTKESIKLHDKEEAEIFQGIPKELKLPPNLYIIGTVNMDETTYSFSPKVLDRAFVVEFHDVDLENYPPQDSESKPSPETIKALRDSILTDLRGEKGKFLARSKEEVNKAVRALKATEYWGVLVELNGALEPYDMHFGYRVVDEIALFFQSAKESQDKGIVEFRDDDEIFDLALLMKVLPKFHGNRKKLKEPLKAILKLCLSENAKTRVQDLGREAVLSILKNWEKEKENFRFKHTARKVLRMLRQLYEIGFASFS